MRRTYFIFSFLVLLFIEFNNSFLSDIFLCLRDNFVDVFEALTLLAWNWFLNFNTFILNLIFFYIWDLGMFNIFNLRSIPFIFFFKNYSIFVLLMIFLQSSKLDSFFLTSSLCHTAAFRNASFKKILNGSLGFVVEMNTSKHRHSMISSACSHWPFVDGIFTLILTPNLF